MGDFLLLLGKLLIISLTGLIGMEMIRDKADKLNYSWSPVMVAIVFAYFIAHCFLAVYEVKLDLIFKNWTHQLGIWGDEYQYHY